MVLYSYISVPIENDKGPIEYMRINLDELCAPAQPQPQPKSQPQPQPQASVITKLCDIFYRNSKI